MWVTCGMPLDDMVPVPSMPVSVPPTLPLIWSMRAWACSQGPRPARDPARNPRPNRPIVFILSSFISSPPAFLSCPVGERSLGPGPANRRYRPSEPGGQPFAAGIRRRGQAVGVHPDEVGVAHAVLVGAEHRDPVAMAAEALGQ